MRRPLLWCCLLLLLREFVLGTDAVALSGRDRPDLWDPGWGGGDHHVSDKHLFGQTCPAGTHLAEDSKEENDSGKCLPCGDGEYMEYPNRRRWCSFCTTCREDQVELSPCQAVRNRVCICRNGTFCPPDHPCEMCQKCRPRCPEGQAVLNPCTPYSDLQCGPATDTGSRYFWIVSVVLILVVILIGICIRKRCSRSPGDRRHSSRGSYFSLNSVFQKLPWCRTVNEVTGDNMFNARLDSQQPHEVTEPGVVVPRESENPERDLVLVPGNNPINTLRRSFYIFAEKIHVSDWRKFGRNLNLPENDILQNEEEEAFYQMLLKWQNREGSESSVNTLLETLDQLHLRGVANDISSALVQKGLFQHGTS